MVKKKIFAIIGLLLILLMTTTIAEEISVSFNFTHDVSFYEDEFLISLGEAIGQDADMVFPALNGMAIWRKKGMVAA